MKNRRIAIVAFLMVAALTLSFGYAAVSNVLDISGSAGVSAGVAGDEFNEDIYFTGVVDASDSVVASITDATTYGYTANINTNNNDKGAFTVSGLKNKGDKVEITYEIKNDSLHEATVAIKGTATNTSDKFGIDYYFGTEDVKTASIVSGGTTRVTVVISLEEQLTGAADGSFILELNVSAGA